jgi:hypothetical protein
MIRMIVDVYDYNNDASFTVELGGYINSSSVWNDTFVIFSSTTNMDITPKVSFGKDSNNYGVIYIGDYTATNQWDYGIISIREVLIGYDGADNVEWNDALQISYATDLGTDVLDNVEDGKGVDAETLGGHLASYFKVEGSAPASHTHDYLPLAGGTISGNLSTEDIFVNGAITSDIGVINIEYVGGVDFHGAKLQDISNPSSGTDGANKNYVDSLTTPLATSTTVGGIKARLDGATLYITTDGTDA